VACKSGRCYYYLLRRPCHRSARTGPLLQDRDPVPSSTAPPRTSSTSPTYCCHQTVLPTQVATGFGPFFPGHPRRYQSTARSSSPPQFLCRSPQSDGGGCCRSSGAAGARGGRWCGGNERRALVDGNRCGKGILRRSGQRGGPSGGAGQIEGWHGEREADAAWVDLGRHGSWVRGAGGAVRASRRPCGVREEEAALLWWRRAETPRWRRVGQEGGEGGVREPRRWPPAEKNLVNEFWEQGYRE
jgi:hypothetical protein